MSKKVFFNEDYGAILEGIDVNEFGFDKVEGLAKDNGLVKKSEFHITIIGKDTGSKIHDVLSKLSKEEKEKKFEELSKLLNSFYWNFSVRSEIYFVTKSYPENKDEEGNFETRKSIIQLVDLPDLEPFYKKFNELLSETFDVPDPPHVTLFSYSNFKENMQRGVGIYSKDNFWSLDPVRIY